MELEPSASQVQQPTPTPSLQEALVAPIDITRFKRKPRIFTEDKVDTSLSPASIPNPVCAFCGKKEEEEKDVLGGFFQSAPMVNKDQKVFVHVACLLSSLEVARSATQVFNAVKAVNRAKKMRCKYCCQYGATLICAVDGCLK